jgi:hypothetical protein
MNCIYGNCGECKEKQIETKPFDQNLPVVYSQWISEKEKREFQNRNQRSHCHQKKRGGDQFMDLLVRVHNELWLKYRKHFFNIKNQFNHYRTTRETLTSTKCVIHIDFAENYVGKMSREIQSKHFGAPQIQKNSTHRLLYNWNYGQGTVFCGVSYSLQHDPMSVWAHLNPILKKIREEHPDVDTLQLFSDGPTSQNKQKLKFYLSSTELFEHGFKKGYWNLHTAGHGKGIPDGIGASLKRSAGIRVKHGEDVVNATDA